MPFRFLTVGPRMLRTGQRLVLREPMQIRLLSLGGFGQFVLVDPVARQITIKRRSFWLRATRRLLFDHVRAVTYSYVDLSEPYTSEFVESHQSIDLKEGRLVRCLLETNRGSR